MISVIVIFFSNFLSPLYIFDTISTSMKYFNLDTKFCYLPTEANLQVISVLSSCFFCFISYPLDRPGGFCFFLFQYLELCLLIFMIKWPILFLYLLFEVQPTVILPFAFILRLKRPQMFLDGLVIFSIALSHQ